MKEELSNMEIVKGPHGEDYNKDDDTPPWEDDSEEAED